MRAGGLIHVGAYDASEHQAARRPMVLIEPQPDVFKVLKRTFRRRNNVTVLNCAVGARGGRRRMWIATNKPSSSLLKPKTHLELHPECSFQRGGYVTVRTLDAIMARIPGDWTELIVDTQGMELDVLRGATRTLANINRLMIEVNTQEVFTGCPHLDDLDRYLTPVFERTSLDLVSEGGHGAWGDAIYERRSAC